MIVRTMYSVYVVEEFSGPPWEQTRFRITKIEDRDPNGHPNVRVGDWFEGDSISVKLGERVTLKGNLRYAETDRLKYLLNGYDWMQTSPVLKIDPIGNDVCHNECSLDGQSIPAVLNGYCKECVVDENS